MVCSVPGKFELKALLFCFRVLCIELVRSSIPPLAAAIIVKPKKGPKRPLFLGKGGSNLPPLETGMDKVAGTDH